MILPMSNIGCIFLSAPYFALYALLLLRQFYSFLLVCFLLGREIRIPISVINMQLHCKLSHVQKILLQEMEVPLFLVMYNAVKPVWLICPQHWKHLRERVRMVTF